MCVCADFDGWFASTACSSASLSFLHTFSVLKRYDIFGDEDQARKRYGKLAENPFGNC
jgi:hypothetical protein